MSDEANRLNALTDRIIGSAIKVHGAIGSSLLELAYEACLYFELARNGLKVERQKPLFLKYEDVVLDCAYRLDLLVDDAVIVEVKSIARFDRIHEAQMDSYLRIAHLRVGLLLNFNVRALIDGGIKRRVNLFPE